MKKKTLYGASAICLLFTACSADQLSEPEVNNGPLDRDQTFYVNMAIHGDDLGTRASNVNGSPDANVEGDFVDGSENEINNAYFVFYDKDGQVVGDIVPIEGLGDAKDAIDGETVETWYQSTIPVVVRKGENTPYQVICYINPISPATLQNPLSVIQTIARTATYTTVDKKNYFAMSNSVFYPQNTEGTGIASEPQIAVAIPEGGLFDTEDDAKAALTDAESTKVVKIYVERYASKVAFKMEKDADAYLTGTRLYKDDGTIDENVNVSLKFSPYRWAVNAESNRSYVIKSFRVDDERGQIMANNYTYDALDGRINIDNPANYSLLTNPDFVLTTLNQSNRWNWNNYTYNRSYWAVSPAYFQEVYPEVAGDITEDMVLSQTYILPKDLYKDNQPAGYEVEVGESSTQYFRESTVGTRALVSANPAAAMPSVILVGDYTITVNGTDYVKPSFYTYLKGSVNVNGNDELRPYIYFDDQTGNEAQPLTSAIPGGGSMLKRFIVQSTIIYTKTDDGKFTRLTVEEAKKRIGDTNLGLAVSEPTKEVKDAAGKIDEQIKLQGNVRTLQITSAAEARGLYIASAAGYLEVVADNTTNVDNNSQITLSEANAILMQQVGYAYYYSLGRGYFNMPIKHLGWYRAGNENKGQDKIDWSKVRVGDFGLVRNHSYTINVSEIKGLASGIGGDNTPIVPPASTSESFIAYSVRILKWAVVPTQNEKL